MRKLRDSLGMVACGTLVGAAFVHAAAAGIHAHSRQAATAFTAIALVQGALAGWIWIRKSRISFLMAALVSLGALVSWGLAKTGGISFVDGLEAKEDPQFADVFTAALELLTFLASAVTLGLGTGTASVSSTGQQSLDPRAGDAPRWLPAVLAATLVAGLIPAMSAPHAHAVGGDTHSDVASHAEAGDHGHGAGEPSSVAIASGGTHGHGDSPEDGVEAALDAVGAHLSPDGKMPTETPTPAEQTAADLLLAETERIGEALRSLTLTTDESGGRWLGDTTDPQQFRSIRDGSTGYEHFIAWKRLDDGKVLDPSAPEALVYRTKAETAGVAAVMYVLPSGTLQGSEPNVGGPLTPWHIHDDLCFNEKNEVAGSSRSSNGCPEGSKLWITAPMLHVWLEDTPCGRFAEIHGAVIAGGTCPGTSHGGHDAHGHSGDVAPTKTEQQEADALVAATKKATAKYVTTADAEAAGYRSIGDALTGHEHFVKSEYLRDDVELDPDRVESLVFEVSPEKKTFVTAMFILKDGSMMEDVPEMGGPLAVWHIHTDLCWVEGGRVAGVHRNGRCFPGGSLRVTSPMLHVWVTESECGPFAGIEGSHGSGCHHRPPKVTGVMADALKRAEKPT